MSNRPSEFQQASQITITDSIRSLFLPISLLALTTVLFQYETAETLNHLELPLMIWLNDLLGQWEMFDWVIVYLNEEIGEGIFVLIIFGLYLIAARQGWGKRFRWRRVFCFAVAIAIVWLTAEIIGGKLEQFINRDSYSMYLHQENFFNLNETYGMEVKTQTKYAFPSGHGYVFYTVLFMAFYRWGYKSWWLFPCVFVLSMPRVFAGSHWITDHLIGSALLCWTLSVLFLRTRFFKWYIQIEDYVTRELEA